MLFDSVSKFVSLSKYFDFWKNSLGIKIPLNDDFKINIGNWKKNVGVGKS